MIVWRGSSRPSWVNDNGAAGDAPALTVSRPSADDLRAIRRDMAVRRAANRRLAKQPQDFDCSPLPLFGDGHKQGDLF